METKTITDYDIQALVDNELDWESEKRVREMIEHDLPSRLRYEEYMRQKNLLKMWWKTQEN